MESYKKSILALELSQNIRIFKAFKKRSMKYIDFIDQTLVFPTPEFRVEKEDLFFHNVRLMDLVNTYGTPLKLTYLPKISANIQRARELFKTAIEKHDYKGNYTFCYCTKSSHFRFVLEKVTENKAQIETSSAFDIPLVRSLHKNGKLEIDSYVICNGFKRKAYTQNIADLINDGFNNCIPILDNFEEFDFYENHVRGNYQVGIRVATDEVPNFEFYTSRLGIRYKDITNYYKDKIRNSKKAQLKVLHFFVSSGMKDEPYFWGEFNRFAEMYCELRKECDTLTILNLGGGLPIKSSLLFEFDYEDLIDMIISNLKDLCQQRGVPMPDIFTEFGSFTVGESGAVLYKVLNSKLQNDKELWYMIDGSFITHLPDSWGLNHKFILLPLNNWSNPYHKVNLGGITCDSMDYYNSEANSQEVYMPKMKAGQEMYLGFFHTGAYQESLGGYGGIQHCLIPSPKHVVIDTDENGQITTELFRGEEEHNTMLNILGYK